MKCMYCGIEVSDEDYYCPKCDKKVLLPSDDDSKAKLEEWRALKNRILDGREE